MQLNAQALRLLNFSPRVSSLALKSLLCLFAAIAVGLIALRFWSVALDDAWITFRYARNLVDGYGLRWNPTDPIPVEGFTSFLHVLLAAVLIALHFDPVQGTKILGLCALLGIIGLFRYHAKHANGGTVGFLFATGLLVGNPFFAFHAVSGMETVFAAFILTLSTVLLYRSFDDDRFIPYLFGSFVIGVLTRPDTALLYGIYFLIIACQQRLRRRFLISTLMFLVLPAVVYAGFKLWYFGDLLPLPFYKKGRIGLPGLTQVIEFNKAFLFGPAVFLVIGHYCGARIKAKDVFILLGITAAILYYVTVRPMVAGGFRFMIPFLPSLFVILIPYVNVLWRSLFESQNRQFQKATAAGVLALLLLTTQRLPRQFVFDFRQLSHDMQPRVLNPLIGRALAGFQNPQDIVLVTGEAGAIPYYSDMFHIDPYGLVTKHESSDRFDADVIFEKKPDVFITHTIEGAANHQGRWIPEAESLSTAQRAINTSNYFTKDFSPVIIADPRFKDYALVKKISYRLNPEPYEQYYIFLRTTSPHYQELAQRFRNEEIALQPMGSMRAILYEAVAKTIAALRFYGNGAAGIISR